MPGPFVLGIFYGIGVALGRAIFTRQFWILVGVLAVCGCFVGIAVNVTSDQPAEQPDQREPAVETERGTSPRSLGDISGTWRGRADGDQDWYDVELSVSRVGGEWSIEIDYPGIDCGGVLEPVDTESGGDVLVLVEQITYGHCIDNGDVRMWRTGGDQLFWEWTDGSLHIWSYLDRVG